MSYARLPYRQFGNQLLETGDLDPVYIMLRHLPAGLPKGFLERFCLAYWCFYHVGTALRCAAVKGKFWENMYKAHYDKWPRGAERRHFRGQTSLGGIDFLADYGTPERIVRDMTAHNSFQEVSKAVRAFPYFGPWIAFKIADMAERVLDQPVDFSDCELAIYRDPYQGAALIAHGDKHADVDIKKVVAKLTKQFSRFTAPPKNDRPVNVQEVETIMCKYKSHLGGHYPIGKDSREIYHALGEEGKLGYKLQTALMKGVDMREWMQ